MSITSRKDYLWNTVAGLINAAEAVIMSMAVTRITSLKDAGYLSIAFAVGNLLMAVGKYGVRQFQVTDIQEIFSFPVYFYTRIVTTFFMLITVILYLFIGYRIQNCKPEKIMTILLICLIYTVESVEDVFWGHYQLRGHLFRGAQLFVYRWCAILVTFIISLLITQTLIIALCFSLFFSIIIFLVCLVLSWRKVTLPKDNIFSFKFSYKKCIKLLHECFPLFLCSFLSFYINNISKYALDKYASPEIQAYYGFIAMPVFVIGLLNSFIYTPILGEMSVEYNNGNYRLFINRIIKQLVILLIITTITVLFSYWCGISLLSILYHTDLSNYQLELVLIMIAGGFLALSGFQIAILTIIRKQYLLLCGYIPVSLLALLFATPIVKRYLIKGAVVSYIALMFFLCICYTVLIYKTIKKEIILADGFSK